MSDQVGSKPTLFGVAHTYIADIGESPLPSPGKVTNTLDNNADLFLYHWLLRDLSVFEQINTNQGKIMKWAMHTRIRANTDLQKQRLLSLEQLVWTIFE